MNVFIVLNVQISYLMVRYTYIPNTFANVFFHQSYLSFEFLLLKELTNKFIKLSILGNALMVNSFFVFVCLTFSSYIITYL